MSSLKSRKCELYLKSLNSEFSHTISRLKHDHSERKTVSEVTVQRSHMGSLIIVQRTKFSLVGNPFLQALQMKCLTLFGEFSAQMHFHSFLSCSPWSSWKFRSTFSFKSIPSFARVSAILWKGPIKGVLSSHPC